MKTTARLHLIPFLPAAALLAVACVAPVELDPTEEGATAEPDLGPSRAHLMPMPGAHRLATVRAADDGSGAWGQDRYNFTYRGGPVISKVKVVTVFWNSTVPNQGGLNSFYQAIVQSPHLDWLSEYNTSKQTIGRGSFVASYVDTGAPTSASLEDRDVQREIARIIGAAEVPPPDADTLYMVHFPAGVRIDMDGNISCQQFCAYHGTFTHEGKSVYYAVMPDFSGACASCGGGGDKLQSTTIISSHELIEAITDPAIGLANAQNNGSLLAWYDDQYGEIGDVCQSESGMVAGWAVQAEYSMRAGACVVTRPDGGGGATPGCAHGVCLTGAPLLSSCGACTEQVCAADPSCCTGGWTASCVQHAVSLCGKHCD